jgi:hypothetical protein
VLYAAYDVADKGVACREQVMLIADAQGSIYVFDIQSMMLSSPKAVHPTSQPLHPPVQASFFRSALKVI